MTTAHIVGHRNADAGYTVFIVHVSQQGGPPVSVARRYNDFQHVHQGMTSVGYRLPPMPPKSFFRKAIMCGFMEKRQQQLEIILSCMVGANPDLSIPVLKAFLLSGAQPVPMQQGVVMAQALAQPYGGQHIPQAVGVPLPQACAEPGLLTPSAPFEEPPYAEAAQVTCPNDHRLKRRKADGAYECDVCGSDISVGECLFDCRACDYSLCQRCHQFQLAAHSPSAFPQPGQALGAQAVYAQPAYAQPGYPQPAQPAYAQPAYAQPAYVQPAQPAYAQPAYAQPAYAQPAYAEPAYAQPAYAQQAYGQPAYGQQAYGQQAYAPSMMQQPYAKPGLQGGAGMGAMAASAAMAGAAGLVGGILLDEAVNSDW